MHSANGEGVVAPAEGGEGGEVVEGGGERGEGEEVVEGGGEGGEEVVEGEEGGEVVEGGGVADGPEAREETPEGFGVQEWSDGSTYEGQFVDGLKHGKGKYTWTNGEYYDGAFYKDYKHGNGSFYWPTGHSFIGKFYLNRKEGFGKQLFPDGSTFEGLYHTDHRFGPGVVSYPDERQDVGLWVRERLLQLCTSGEDSFSLETLPEYGAYLDPSALANCLTQMQSFSSTHQIHSRTSWKVRVDNELLLDETSILPPGIESYSTDGDFLPLPHGRRRELDELFYGDLWEPDSNPYQGYERDPLSFLPLVPRMQTHIHNHRLQTENLGWSVADVLSLRRGKFGPEGPLELNSKLLIQRACCGDLQGVSQILRSGLVHPDVADSSGHTALIAATINSHDDVINLLLDMGADIDKLNCEGMSALAVCHALYYPFRCLDTTVTELSAKILIVESPSSCSSSSVELNQDSVPVTNTTQSSDTDVKNDTSQGHSSDRTSKESTEHLTLSNSEVSSEHTSECNLKRDEPQSPADSGHLQEEEGERNDGGHPSSENTPRVKEKEGTSVDEKEKQWEENQSVNGCAQTWDGVEREFEIQERAEEHVGHGESRAAESGCDNVEKSAEEDPSLKEQRECENVPGVERSIEVVDGHISLGSVQWIDRHPQLQDKDIVETTKEIFNSARRVSSYSIQVTDGLMQCSAEALSHAGVHHRCDTQGTVRRMAAMIIEHRARLETIKLLLARGANPNVSRVPMPVLFLAIMAADIEAVKRLLMCGAHTDIPLPPERKGLYPLHIAAALPGPAGPKITEMLLYAIIDSNARACNQDEIYEKDKVCLKNVEPSFFSRVPNPQEGGQTALHIACQRESDYENASKVVALLLSHGAKTDLLWSGHSPLSLALASGNELAVELLLKGGADPNQLLGDFVGNALCALINVRYNSDCDKIKLLDMLAQHGVDFLMPVRVGDAMGSIVDFAHYSFKQDVRISITPLQALNPREREIHKARRQLLAALMKYMRVATALQKKDSLLTSGLDLMGKKKAPFGFCFFCGRSATWELVPCNRCHKAFYCSKTCKVKAWEELHKSECTGAPDAILRKSRKAHLRHCKKTKRQQSVIFKFQKARQSIVIVKEDINLKENYSFN